MRTSTVFSVLALVVASCMINVDSHAQGSGDEFSFSIDEGERAGFWISGGIGLGSLGCEDCDEREGGGSVAIALGGTINPNFQLGGSINAWSKTENSSTLTVATITGVAKYYPASDFYIQGGIGVGTVDISFEEGGFSASVSNNGFGALIGFGYDIGVSSALNITPFVNVFATSSDEINTNVAQIGLALSSN